MKYPDDRDERVWGLDEQLTFGKYKGRFVGDILREDPQYLVWAHDNISYFLLEDELYEALVYNQYQPTNPGPAHELNPNGNPWPQPKQKKEKW